ncbi:NAD-dependent epimerase/dehydratase family protein [Streptomyces sp.]|uniref:NAD-dependent epimerase/dehydratase family protein n=1 Tax=Streptomyces sp. TaxID=1931 RepID=UPI002F406E09
MRVLVAGGSGVIGRKLLPLLTSVGHDVVVIARSGKRVVRLESTGAKIVIADALDRDAVLRAVDEAGPDAIVNMLTAIPSELNPRRLAKEFEQTNLLRTVGTRNLIEAGERSGVRQVISQGLAYAYEPDGSGLANEDTSFWTRPPKQFVPVLAALKELEQRTQAASGLVLRFGHLYGPGSIYASDGSFVQQVKAGKVPLVGGGTSTFSFTHAHDAATAIVAALDKTVSGALNIVDDDPVRMSVWLPVLADILGAKAPKGAPAAIAKLAVGGWGVAYMTRLRGADNARAKLALDWRPRHASWRDGFAAELKGKAVAA